jgi:leucyl/phenylalanyl-tRNA--protein transferase
MTGRAPRIAWISRDDSPDAFPPVDQAFTEPDGLLAAGGDLSADRLLYAYRHGIFPWYDDGQPILWWSPDPRCVLIPQEFHLARRLRRALRSSGFEVSFNSAFDEVIEACSEHREGQSGTWITAGMKKAFKAMHRDGFAHSVDVWRGGVLIGGLYGLSIGRVFFGESMFSRESNASKAAMLALCGELAERQFELLDCQVDSPHLSSLGAKLIPRPEFARILGNACKSGTCLELPSGVRRPITDYLPE